MNVIQPQQTDILLSIDHSSMRTLAHKCTIYTHFNKELPSFCILYSGQLSLQGWPSKVEKIRPIAADSTILQRESP